MLKRFFLFFILNACVVLTISFIVNIFGLYPKLTHYGIHWKSVLIFCAVWGMGGAFISLALSRTIAKWMLQVALVDDAHPLAQKVHSLARRAGLKVPPQVGIFPSAMVNAFATGPTHNRSLIAVSSALLDKMENAQLDAILGHEITHIQNGDMVTMTLLQGVVNTFVMFLARLFAFFITQTGKNKRSSPLAFTAFVWLFEIAFMLLGTLLLAWFSRQREYRADAGGARITSRSQMIHALQTLAKLHDAPQRGLPQAMQALMLRPAQPQGLFRFFMTHPPLEARIARLQATPLTEVNS